MESSSLIFAGSRSGRSTIVTAVFVIALTVGAVGVTAFVLYTVFAGWNTGAGPSRHGAAKALVGKGRTKAPVSPRNKGPCTPRWYSVLVSDLNSTSTAVDDVTFTNRLINDTSLRNDGAENDVVQPVGPALDESEPSSTTTEKGTEAADAVVSTTAEGEPFAPESRHATKSGQDDVTSEPNTEYASREQGDRDDDDTRPRSQVVSSTATAAEEGDLDNHREDEFARETDAVEANFNDATSDTSARTEGVIDTVPRDQTRVVWEQGTNYEPAERDNGSQRGDELPSSGKAQTEVTAAIPRDVGHEIQEEEPDYDSETSPATEVRDTLDSTTEGVGESPITVAVSDVAAPDGEDGVGEVSKPFSTDRRFPATVFPGEVTDAHSRAGGAGETEPPYPNEDVTEQGIDTADIQGAARDSADIRDDAHTVSTRVTTYQVDDPTESVPQDVQAHKGNRVTGFHVTPKGASIYTQGGSEAESYRNDANSDEESSSTTAALVITYGPTEDVEIFAISDEDDEELAKITTQRREFSGTPRHITTKDHFGDIEFIDTASGAPSQNPEATEAGQRRPYSTSEGNWDETLLDLENTVEVGDEDATTDTTSRKMALITRYKNDGGPSTTRATVEDNDFDKTARGAYSSTKDSSGTEPLGTNPTTDKNTENTPTEPRGIDEGDGTTYLSDDMDWSEWAELYYEALKPASQLGYKKKKEKKKPTLR
ncbi:uncharacterized protein LOC119397502 [Rhipicephalus sanguineus]|uniref:uncharacterized protein LOC119397502 n=1 Tax=Rhipicephalus sanguineus TaxID=34632 RepID=UPI001893F6A5|nr:uncharacterized protein LOC119397502 [Rhipicephalus sanguineus]